MEKQINDFRFRLEREKGKKDLIIQEIRKVKKSLHKNKEEYFFYEKAIEIVKKVGIETQQQFQYRISSIVSLALNAVFEENPYELQVEFVERRNKTECDLFFQRNGDDINPLEASGGGAVDVASFGLRIASWSMQQPHTRNVIILDEPLRFLSKDRQAKASQVIKELSDKLNLQFIIVTHEQELTEFADKTFKVSNVEGVSNVQEI